MKRILIFFSLCISSAVFSQGGIVAQNFTKVMSDLKEKIGEIIVDKTTYTQSIEALDETKGKIRYESIAVNEKGESAKTAYEFYISDIDKNTLIKKPSGKKFFVSLWLNNKQKFIKYYKDDKFEAYTDNIEILVLGSDVAQNVIDLLKSAIPLVKSTEKSWATASEALSWLKSNIGEVKDKTGNKQQTFSFTDNTNLLELAVSSTDSKGAVTEEKYFWNVTDLNKNKIGVKISGTLLNISLEIKNGDKFIRYMKGGELQNYISTLEIASEDIDHARNVISAFNSAFDKSKAKTMEFKTTQAAMEFIKSNVGEAASDQKTRQQKIEFSAGPSLKCIFTADEADSKGKTISNQYEFYITDAEPNLIFKVSGKKIIIPVLMTGKNKYIRYTKDNNLQNYVEDLEIFQPDIETARDVVTALSSLIKGSKEAPAKFNSVPEAMKFLQSNIEGASIGADQYKVSFEGSSADPFASTYQTSKTDAKGIVTDENFIFYPYLLDVNSIKVETAGKYLTITSLVSGKKAYVKKIKKDQTSFVNELSIICFDVKNAKDVAAALRFLSANTTPKAKAFANKQAALDFVKQNIGDVSAGTKTIKQKIEVADDNPCKINYTVTTSDDKGKTVEEVFEFTLLDINKQMIDFKPLGSNVSVVLSCKNKQKLVKAYKDGAQQSFASDIELLCTDVDVAKNLAEALKTAAGLCE
jgi:hypothetical protein